MKCIAFWRAASNKNLSVNTNVLRGNKIVAEQIFENFKRNSISTNYNIG